MFRVHAGVVDYAIIAVYFAVVLGIGFAANLGALEILGLAANGAKYGAATVHFPLRAEDLEKPDEEES